MHPEGFEGLMMWLFLVSSQIKGLRCFLPDGKDEERLASVDEHIVIPLAGCLPQDRMVSPHAIELVRVL